MDVSDPVLSNQGPHPQKIDRDDRPPPLIQQPLARDSKDAKPKSTPRSARLATRARSVAAACSDCSHAPPPVSGRAHRRKLLRTPRRPNTAPRPNSNLTLDWLRADSNVVAARVGIAMRKGQNQKKIRFGSVALPRRRRCSRCAERPGIDEPESPLRLRPGRDRIAQRLFRLWRPNRDARVCVCLLIPPSTLSSIDPCAGVGRQPPSHASSHQPRPRPPTTTTDQRPAKASLFHPSAT